MPGHLRTLREREAYLRERVEAKKRVGWECVYDERERAALAWAIERLEAVPTEGLEPSSPCSSRV